MKDILVMGEGGEGGVEEVEGEEGSPREVQRQRHTWPTLEATGEDDN